MWLKGEITERYTLPGVHVIISELSMFWLARAAFKYRHTTVALIKTVRLCPD
jgi:hypothetical protein